MINRVSKLCSRLVALRAWTIAPGRYHVHDASMHGRHIFGGARGKTSRPRQAAFADVLFIDLLQMAEALGVEGAAEHQPVVGAGILSMASVTGFEVLDLGGR